MRAIAPGVHDALRNPLMVEMEDLLAEVKVFQDRRPSSADFQRVLIVGYRSALSCRQNWNVDFRNLMEFPAFAPLELLIVDRRGLNRRLSRGLGHCVSLQKEMCAFARLSKCRDGHPVPDPMKVRTALL